MLNLWRGACISQIHFGMANLCVCVCIQVARLIQSRNFCSLLIQVDSQWKFASSIMCILQYMMSAPSETYQVLESKVQYMNSAPSFDCPLRLRSKHPSLQLPSNTESCVFSSTTSSQLFRRNSRVTAEPAYMHVACPRLASESNCLSSNVVFES